MLFSPASRFDSSVSFSRFSPSSLLLVSSLMTARYSRISRVCSENTQSRVYPLVRWSHRRLFCCVFSFFPASACLSGSCCLCVRDQNFSLVSLHFLCLFSSAYYRSSALALLFLASSSRSLLLLMLESGSLDACLSFIRSNDGSPGARASERRQWIAQSMPALIVCRAGL